MDFNTISSKVTAKIDEIKERYISASHAISANPELSLNEYFAADTLVNLLEQEGFAVKRHISGYETAFIAGKEAEGHGGASLAFIAEYDALPEIGHACGHNIIGTASALAACGLAEALSDVAGRVMVIGSPAEEGGEGGCAKAAFVRDGLFDDIDAALMVHPCDYNDAHMGTLAVRCYAFEFFGKTAHASASPEKGINALDAMIMLFNGVSLMRQQLEKTARVHGIITHGGLAPNIIPDYTKAKFLVRGTNKASAQSVLERVIKIAEGAALATGCTLKTTRFCNDYDEMIVTPSFDRLFMDCAEAYGFVYNPEEFGRARGSTDAGNVSQIIPLIHPLVKTSEEPASLHTVEFRDACITPFADEALVNSAKALALTGLRLLTDGKLLNDIKSEHRNMVERYSESSSDSL